MRALSARLLAGLVVPLLCLPSCAGRKGTPLPSLVLITLDTTRADHLSAYGYFRETSPAIDDFGRECIVFDRCIVPMAVTLPSHVSILTSTYPMEHGVLANLQQGRSYFAPSPGLRSLASVCRDAGYETAAFVSAVPVRKGTGVEAGFDRFDQPGLGARNAGATTDAAISWIQGRVRGGGERPCFLWVHYFDPHQPLRPPEPFDRWFQTDRRIEEYMREREWPDVVPSSTRKSFPDVAAALNAYDGEIRYMDGEIRRLLECLREMPDWEGTLVLLIGDHGEGLSQHGEFSHRGIWEEQLRVPLMMRVPGERARRDSVLISAVDVFPTLLGFVDSDAFEPFFEQASGRDVFAGNGDGRFVLSQDSGQKMGKPDYRYSLTTERWKYIWFPDGDDEEDLLYDLTADPFELRDVSEENREVALALRDSLRAQLAAQTERGSELGGGQEVTEVPVDSMVLEELRALGYAVD